MNRSRFDYNLAATALMGIALIASLSVPLYTSAAASNESTNLLFGTVKSPLLAGTPAATRATVTTYMPNYVHYAVTVRHWDKKEVTVHVDASAADDKSPQEVADAVSESLAIWNSKVGGTVTLKATNDVDADIDINLVKPGTLPGTEIGLTQVRFFGQSIAYAEVQVNAKLPKTDLVQVMAHELGHALGIQGHSDDRNDLMYPYAHLPAQITDRDMNTFRTGYGEPASVAAAATSVTVE